MKTTNIALHAVLAAISTASRASAQGYVRGSVEEREEVRRETMGDLVSTYVWDECAEKGNPNKCETCGELIADKMKEIDTTATLTSEEGLFNIRGDTTYMEACSAVAADNDACLGCQGYELEGKMTEDATKGMVHIPGCVNMTLGDCKKLAKSIVDKHLDWFPKGTTSTNIKQDQRQVTSQHDMWYWNLALPIKGGVSGLTENVMNQEIAGLAGDCMVYYPWTWCLETSTGNTQCTKLAPFDCSEGENGGSNCLTAQACCERIQGDAEKKIPARYLYPDINGNRLQCYAWGLDTPDGGQDGGEDGGDGGGDGEGGGGGGGGGGDSDGGSEGGAGLRLIVHINRSRVALPAIITARDDFVVVADRGIAPVFEEDNLNKWENNQLSTESIEIEMVTVNNEVWKQKAAGEVDAGTGYKADK